MEIVKLLMAFILIVPIFDIFNPGSETIVLCLAIMFAGAIAHPNKYEVYMPIFIDIMSALAAICILWIIAGIIHTIRKGRE